MSREKIYRNLLVGLLDCGYADLNILDNCEYDINALKEVLIQYGMEIHLNNLAWAMFELGKREMKDWITDRINELEDIFDSEDNTGLFKELGKELNFLKELDPYDDIESYHNYLDTHIYIKKHEDIYKEYCKKALNTFEERTGFSL